MQGIVFMVSSAEALRQRLPSQDLSRLSLVSQQPKKLKEWVSALPMINVGETSRQVFQTLQEIGRLNVDAAARFELLEILRPTVHSLGNALSKHYLNQSVMLPDRATKVATLAQAMQSHLANGYKLVVLAGLEKLDHSKRDVELVKLVAQAIHRAITEITGNLLRSTQLYLNTPPKLWLELNTLYLMAVRYQLIASIRVADAVTQRQIEKSSIEDAYKRALLLATCKPNKLRQNEIAQIYQLSELWAPLVTLREFGGSGELFVFDLTKDAPPTYRSQAQAADAGHVRAIDPAELVNRLGELRQVTQSNGPKGTGETALSLGLLTHLIQTWSELSERSFSRVAHEGTLEACLGLTATHYFISGGQDFEVMMMGEQKGFGMVADLDNPFMKAKPITLNRPDERTGKDVWSLAFGSSDLEAKDQELAAKLQADATPVARYVTHTCQIVNISPGGYCIEWSGEVPASVRAGEILGLHEDDAQPGWSIGVIRWVKQLPGHGAQLGIEVLAPKAKPCGARVIKKTGDASEYMRTLLLPELKAINRPATLITPALTFRSGYKVVLKLDGEEIKAHLAEQVSATASFCQFEFQLMRRPADNHGDIAGSSTSDAGDDEDFDSIWASL
jgi:cyclic-di-GMP-binding protein